MSVYSRLDRPIVISEYDPLWPQLFGNERDKIRAVLGERVRMIEHIGSTAVPNLAAKPTIDIGIGLRSLGDAPPCISLLEEFGYMYEPTFEAEIPDRRFLWKGTPTLHIAHLHMAAVDTSAWIRPIAFRDYLRNHPDEAQTYAMLKKHLAAVHGIDIDAYMRGKTAFVEAILTKAGTP
jgi:GrpB-like predicted nucleotidyltransferase (UPF0157 family)